MCIDHSESATFNNTHLASSSSGDFCSVNSLNSSGSHPLVPLDPIVPLSNGCDQMMNEQNEDFDHFLPSSNNLMYGYGQHLQSTIVPPNISLPLSNNSDIGSPSTPSPMTNSSAAAAAAAAAASNQYYSNSAYLGSLTSQINDPNIYGCTNGSYYGDVQNSSVSAITAWSNRYINSMQAANLSESNNRSTSSPTISNLPNNDNLTAINLLSNKSPLHTSSNLINTSSSSLLYPISGELHLNPATLSQTTQHISPNTPHSSQMLLCDSVNSNGLRHELNSEVPNDCTSGSSFCSPSATMFTFDHANGNTNVESSISNGLNHQILSTGVPTASDFYMCGVPQSPYMYHQWNYTNN